MKLTSRIVAILLVPCLALSEVEGLAAASSLNYPLSLGGRGPAALGVRGDVVIQCRFEEEALASMALQMLCSWNP